MKIAQWAILPLLVGVSCLAWVEGLNHQKPAIIIDARNQSNKTNRQNETKKIIKEKVVAKVVFDGDTVLLADGRKVRLKGVDATEFKHEKKVNEPFAKEAQKFLMEKTLHKEVDLVRYEEDIDRFERVLGDLQVNGDSISEGLIEAGLVYVFIESDGFAFKPYLAKQTTAQNKKIGLWGELSSAWMQDYAIKLGKEKKLKDLLDEDVYFIGKLIEVKKAGPVLKLTFDYPGKNSINVVIYKNYWSNLPKWGDDSIGSRFHVCGEMREYEGAYEVHIRYPHQIIKEKE